MKAAVLSEKSGISGTCSQRITACARFCASVCLSVKVPSAAWTSIIGMAGRDCHDAAARGIARSRHLIAIFSGSGRGGVVGRAEAPMDVVVDHADVLHERVDARRPHEAVPLRLQLLRERLRLWGRLG